MKFVSRKGVGVKVGREKLYNMTHKIYFHITSAIFAIITLLHFSRLIFGWTAIVGDYEVPMWMSYVGTIAAGFLSLQAFKLNK